MEREIIEEVTGNYMRLSGSGAETVADRMFMYQNIPGFLPMEVTWINGQKQYTYDISGKITCGKYFSESTFGVPEITHIIEQIFELPQKLSEYLLDGGGAVIHETYLYYDVRTREIAAVYYPDSPYRGIHAISSFLEFLMEQVNQTDRQTMFFIYGLHGLTKEEGITSRQIKAYMNERKSAQEEAGEKGETPIRCETVPVVKEREEGKREKTRSKIHLQSACILPGILVLTGILIPLILSYMGCFSSPVSGEWDGTMAMGATLFFLGITGFGAWKLLPDKKGDVTWEEDGEDRKKVCLIPCQGREEPLPVPYFPFLLGSEKDRVDGVITALGASPIHAQIMQEGNRIMVMDEESENGTFYNDRRLMAWQKTVLCDGDLLRFGEGEYVVEITM